VRKGKRKGRREKGRGGGKEGGREGGRAYNGAVDEDGEEDDEAHVRQVRDAFREGTANDGRGDDRELQLEEGEKSEGDGVTKVLRRKGGREGGQEGGSKSAHVEMNTRFPP